MWVPEQTLPTAQHPGEIVAFGVQVYPEGVGARVGSEAGKPMTPELTAAFEAAKALVPDPLPAPIPPSCCSSGRALFIFFADGETAIYGPCNLPEPLAQALHVVYSAYLNE
jgi:hypothetical protein